nr:uncharacterized protein LOC112032909 [Quercus suber]
MVAEDEDEFNYDEKCEKGPPRWGQIRTEWSMCGHGTVQSPIDLLNKGVEVVSYLGRLKKDEGEFNYDEKCEKGPSRWGEIRTEWSMCGHGTVQSPIDLLNKRVEVAGPKVLEAKGEIFKARSGQILASMIKPETDPKKPENDETRIEKSDKIVRVDFG